MTDEKLGLWVATSQPGSEFLTPYIDGLFPDRDAAVAAVIGNQILDRSHETPTLRPDDLGADVYLRGDLVGRVQWCALPEVNT